MKKRTIVKQIKRLLKYGIVIGFLIFLSIFISNKIVELTTQDKIYDSTADIPSNKVGLLLGTGKILSNGRINLYYKYRIDAVVQLFKAGKIEFILISGDNGHKNYDEPTTMKKDLVALGIPASKIYLDYAGFRTLDSVVRCKEIFGQQRITIVSQQFHNERAIFIAGKKGLDAVGYNARDVNARYGFKTRMREQLARVKVIIDLVFGAQPKFLGKKIEIQ